MAYSSDDYHYTKRELEKLAVRNRYIMHQNRIAEKGGANTEERVPPVARRLNFDQVEPNPLEPSPRLQGLHDALPNTGAGK